MGDPFMATGFGELKVFSGSAHPELAREISAFLGVSTGQSRLRRFPDSEVSFQIDENIRGTDVFIVQPTSNPVDQHLVAIHGHPTIMTRKRTACLQRNGDGLHRWCG